MSRKHNMSTTTTTWPLTPDGRLLVLRTCDENMKAHGGFQWPTEGHVEAPDWDPDPSLDCGGGLHGLPWGCGNVSLLSTATGAHWLVVAVDPADVANLDQPGKIRFRTCEVVLVSTDRDEAVGYLLASGAFGLPVVFGTATAGYAGTATAGDCGTATAGDCGTATAGDCGTATAGYRGTATAGDRGTATAGYAGTATAGYRGTATAGYAGTATAGYGGTATAGDCGTATAGYRGTATAGYRGTATAGYRGTATAGYAGTATAGYRGTATAGDGGRLVLSWWDGKANRSRLIVGYVGEDGIKANTAYRCDSTGKLIEAVPA